MALQNSALFRTTLRVRYAETDQMGVVYHANYFVWFEMGRVELLRGLGFDYKQMEAEDCHLPVVEATCRYRLPARYDDVLILETRAVALRGFVMKFAYRLLRPPVSSVDVEASDLKDELLAEAETTHIVVDSQMQKRALPEK